MNVYVFSLELILHRLLPVVQPLWVLLSGYPPEFRLGVSDSPKIFVYLVTVRRPGSALTC